jgi:hypothetical protein
VQANSPDDPEARRKFISQFATLPATKRLKGFSNTYEPFLLVNKSSEKNISVKSSHTETSDRKRRWRGDGEVTETISHDQRRSLDARTIASD